MKKFFILILVAILSIGGISAKSDKTSKVITDGIEWLFIPSTDENKEWKTAHNGCYCLSEENIELPYFNPQSGHVNNDNEIQCIRMANTYEIDSFIDVLDYYNYTINENNNIEKIK